MIYHCVYANIQYKDKLFKHIISLLLQSIVSSNASNFNLFTFLPHKFVARFQKSAAKIRLCRKRKQGYSFPTFYCGIKNFTPKLRGEHLCLKSWRYYYISLPQTNEGKSKNKYFAAYMLKLDFLR